MRNLLQLKFKRNCDKAREVWRFVLLAVVLCFGFAHTGCGAEQPDYEPTQTAVIFNEIDCRGTDWAEVVNASEYDVDISGWIFTDKPSDSAHRYAAPDGTIVKPGERFVFNQEKDLEPGFTFGIKCGSDTLYMFDKNMVCMDKVKVGAAEENTTWGRLPDSTGEWAQTPFPTKGNPNLEIYPPPVK